MHPPNHGDVAPFGAGEMVGPYLIEELIGTGGMGRVYRAHDTELDRKVAIKVLRDVGDAGPELRNRFEREARIIAKLDHPSICTLLAVGEYKGISYFVMQYVVGDTLANKLTARSLEPIEIIRFATDITDAVAAAHRQNVIHRDLKPSNIMVTESGVKLLDFGIAKVLSDSNLPTFSAITRERAMIGTLRYMSPEVLSGDRADTRSDIFALGAVLHEMATGQPAFAGDTPAATIAAILNHHPPPVLQLRPDLPPALDQIIAHCLAKDPGSRWQHAGDIVHQLRWITDGHLRTPLPANVLPNKSREKRKWKPAAVAAATLVAALSGGVYLLAPLNRFVAFPHVTALPCEAQDDLTVAGHACTGLAEDLTRRLTKLTKQPIQVTTLGESIRRGARSTDATRAAIGATHVLTGRVTRKSGRVEFDYRVANTTPGANTKDEVFSLAANEAYEGQDLLAAFVARRLSLQLDHVERTTLTNPITSSAAAFDAYLKGLGILRTATRDAALTDRMLGSFSDAALADPGFAEAHAMNGFAAWSKFEQTRDITWRDASVAACDRAIQANRQLPEAHGCRGQWLHSQNQHREAAIELRAAVDADPSYDDAIVWLGREFEDQRDFAGAEAIYRAAVTSRPWYWASHAWLGNFMRRQARYEEAAEEYEAVVQRIPDSARAHAVAGIPLMYVGRYSDAVHAFERSVALEPAAEAYVNWGITLGRMRQFHQADEKLAQAQKLGATGHQVLGNAGRIAFYRKRPEQAAELYRRAIAAAQSELASPARKQDANLALAEYSAKLGHSDDARAFLTASGVDRGSTTRPNDPHLLFFAGIVLNQLGDREAALAWLERAVYWGVPTSELIAFPELDGLRDEPAFKNLIAKK